MQNAVVVSPSSPPPAPVARLSPPTDNDALVPGAPVEIRNGASVSPATRTPSRRELTARKLLILAELRDSTDPTAPQLAAMLKEKLRNAPDAATREAIIARFEHELSKPEQLLPALKNLCCNILNATTQQYMWRLSSQALPGITGVASAAQVARALYDGDWRAISAALPSLLPYLPALRSVDSIEALIRSLPTSVVEALQSMHDWVKSADDATTLELGIEEAGGALAAAVLLWQLHSRLPQASGQRTGDTQFIANLPHHWRKLVSLNGLGGQLFAPAQEGPGMLRRLDRKEMAAFKRAEDLKHLPGFNETIPLPYRLAPARSSALLPTTLDLQKAAAPHPVATPGPIADSPLDELYAANSPASRAGTGWLDWLGTALACWGGRAGFNQLAQSEGMQEMVPMERSNLAQPLNRVTVETPLMGDAAPVATGATGGLVSKGTGFIKRNPLAAATTALFAAAGAAATAAYRFWPSAPESLSTTELADRLMGDIVALGDDWGTGVDLLLGTPDLPGGRERRDVSDNRSDKVTDAPPIDDTVQLGITVQQRDALLGDNDLRQHLSDLQMWSLAVAQDLGSQAGWQWITALPASEQELVVNQLHTLRKLLPALAALQAQPQALLDKALDSAGWKGGSTGLSVDLGAVKVAGVTVQQQMPLLEYCLLRADHTPSKATFLRDGTPLTQQEQDILRRFAGGTVCAQLGEAVNTHGESLRPAMLAAIKARLVIDAVKAKSQDDLGGSDAYVRGADIVLGYLNGHADVESSALTYTDVLKDGTRVSFQVPNYLVLRSASNDPDLRGQVVLYRADVASFRAFSDENAFRQFLDDQRARAGLPVVDGGIDHTLARDIVAAAPSAYRTQVDERVASWEQRYVLFQTGKGGNQAWNPGDSFVLDFKPCTTAQHTLQDWAGALVRFGQTQQEHQLAFNRLRWSSLGMAHVDIDNEVEQALKKDLQSLQTHAHDAVESELKATLQRTGLGDVFPDLNPDQVSLRIGGHVMSLTEWATSGWQQHGLPRPVLPLNIGDIPGEGIAVPVDPQPLQPWPSNAQLFDMDVTVYRVDDAGTRTRDDARTDVLLEADARRALCGMLADFAESNALADAYTDYLKVLANTPKSAFHSALANQVRVHTAWMIELAYQNGELDKATYTALMAEHALLEPAKGRRSALKGVTLNGHGVNGIWALKAKGMHYVFLPGTVFGDQLLDEKAFARWLKEPESETYILAHTAMRYRVDLEKMFRKKEAAKGIVFGFETTRGPKHVAGKHIDARIADVDEMTVSQLERFNDAMVMVGSVVAALSCTLATAGAAAAVCASSTLALVGDAIASGADFLERGDIDGAIGQIGGGVVDAVDVMNLANIPMLLFQLGRRGLSTVSDATQALHQWQRQARGFAPDGRVNAGFATSRQQLSDTGLPMLEQPLSDGGTLYHQGGRDYIQQDGQFVESYVADGENGRRLRMPDEPDAVGPPVEYTDGQWQRPKQSRDGKDITTPRTVGGHGTTPLPPKQAHPWIEKVPDAELLPPEKLDEIEAVFGIRRPGITPSPDLRQKVQELAMESRIQQIILNPDALGNPGDEAIIMRAWADSPVLGNGRSVETYTQDLGEWTRGARFGKGPVGMMVEVTEPKQLPTLQQLIDASDIDALLQRLGLPQDTSNEKLFATVKAELVAIIGKDPAQSLLSWSRWVNAQHRLPTAADNLIKHFPMLTKKEAEALVASNPVLAHKALSWVFPDSTSKEVANILAQRGQRETREHVLNGQFNSPSKVQELSSHLQKVLPGRSWRVTSDPTGQGNVLSFTRPDEKENVVRKLTFSNNGQVSRPTTLGGSEPVSTWQQGIYDQLSPTGQQDLPGSYALRDRVVENMKDTPLAQSCAVPAKVGKGKQIVKRSLDCDPPPAISLSEHDVEQRDALGQVMQQVRESMAAKHAIFSAEEVELKQLQIKKAQLAKKKETLSPDDLKRLDELEQKPFGSLKSFDIMNFASYKFEDLSYQGVPIVFSENFPVQGTAGSGNPRPLLATEGLVEGVPVRRVLVPEEEALDSPTLSGWYQEDYAMGADLLPVLAGRNAEKNQASQKIVLTEEDLRVTRPGTSEVVALSELTDDEIVLLDMSHYSPVLQQHIGHASLLPGNARYLKPGTYRVYQIRSCSEGKILDNWFKALSSALPELSPKLWGSDPAAITSLTGTLYMITEMNPCEVSCDGRLRKLMAKMPGLDLKVLYRYENNGQRKQWVMDQKLNRVIEKNRDRWELEGVPEGEMRARARTEMNTPETRQWLEEDFKRRPMEEPVPRLWVPTETNEF